MRLMPIVTVGERDDGGHAGIRMPDDPLGVHGGIKVEGGILLVQTVIIAARKKRTHEQARTLALAEQTPANLRELRFTRDENFLLEARAVLKFESPARPRLGGELFNELRSVTPNNIRRVVLR